MSKTANSFDLSASIATILIACGSSEAEAQTVAANLVMANLSGHDSHGVGMVPRYVSAVLEGGLQPNAQMKTLLDLGHMVTLDGQHGYGQVIGEQAMQLGIARTKQHGSCIMTLANSHHLGRIGHWAEMATAQGLVSLHFVNVMSRPVVAPWLGSDGRFGTNPCCIGIPLVGREPFILDFATSRVAQGKMRVAYNEGRVVASGLLIDEKGQPTTNPGVVVVPQSNGLFGALMTFGEHKGYGMAVACELLGGALSGGGTWQQPATTDKAKRATILNNMLTVLIDPAKLGTQASFELEAQAFVDWLQQSPPSQSLNQDAENTPLNEPLSVQIAGDPERRTRAQRLKDGIVIDDQTWMDIVDAGAKVGVAVN